MKGTLKVKGDTVTIEEFSYPLEQFLIDEPDFKAPKADELLYQRGEGTLLYVGDNAKKDEKNYPADLMEIFIARKKSYRGAFKARRNAAAQGRNWRDEIEQDKPKAKNTEPYPDTENENDDTGNTGDDDTPDQNGDQSQTDKNENDDNGSDGDATENQGGDTKPDADDKTPKDDDPKKDDESKKDEDPKKDEDSKTGTNQRPVKDADKPAVKPENKDKKPKSTKQKDAKDGNNQAN